MYDAIQKWDRNASCQDAAEAKTGYLTCPLCNLYYDRGCKGCPVASETGQPLCRGTSYLEAAAAKDMVVQGLAPIASFQKPAREYADLLRVIWRKS